MAYFLQRYGEEMTQAVVSNPNNGVAGFNAVLAERSYSERFDDIFADFLAANYLNDPQAGEGRWGYKNLRRIKWRLAALQRLSCRKSNHRVSIRRDYIN
jgi:hypothetical protein